jgi:beta-hydroxylase
MGQPADDLLATNPVDVIEPSPMRGVGIWISELFSAIVIRRAKIVSEWLIRRSGPNGNATFFEPDLFPWAKELELEWRSIRAELDAVLSAPAPIPEFTALSPQQRGIVQGRAWKSYFLFVTGRRHEPNASRCPDTIRLLQRIPGLESAFFSILEPGTRITPHRGPYGGVLRYHLALIVPEPRTICGIRVGTDVAHWEQGRSLVFDDSHDHEAWNDSEERRVVLFVDFERPLPLPLGVLNRAMLRLAARAAFIQEIRHKLREHALRNAPRERFGR